MPLSDYEIGIGLDVHVQLATPTKLFCGCKAEFSPPPNARVCPVCMGLPNALPIPNRAAFDRAIAAGIALGGRIHPIVRFGRKSYFCPDLPKGYQITQVETPLIADASLDFTTPDGRPKRVRIERAHLEEDEGKIIHHDGQAFLDFARAGVPLLEIVTAPELRSGAEAAECVEALQHILRYAEVSGCRMERGEMRVAATISLRRPIANPHSTAAASAAARAAAVVGVPMEGERVEIKNMNSVRAVRQALTLEAFRQAAILDAGGQVVSHTREWRDRRESAPLPTVAELCAEAVVPVEAVWPKWPEGFRAFSGYAVALPTKSAAPDYRYVPDPDLPPIVISAAWIDDVRRDVQENPYARFARYQADFGLSVYHAATLVFELGKPTADYFEDLIDLGAPPRAAATVLLNHVQMALRKRRLSLDRLPLSPRQLVALARSIENRALPNVALSKLFSRLLDLGPDADVDTLVAAATPIAGVVATAWENEELESAVRAAVAEDAKSAAAVRAGKSKALERLIGAVMRATERRFSAALIRERLRRELGLTDG